MTPMLQSMTCRALVGWLAVAGFACHLNTAAADTDALQTPAMEVTGLKVSADVLFDDNVTRVDTPSEILSDEVVHLGLSDQLLLPFTPYLRLLATGGAGFDQYVHWQRLSSVNLNAALALQYRPSAAFLAPTLEFGIRAAPTADQSSIRSGVRSVADLSVMQPITDQITSMLVLEHDERRAENGTFDGHGDALRVHLEDMLSATTTLYVSASRRYGDSVTSQLACDGPPAALPAGAAASLLAGCVAAGPPNTLSPANTIAVLAHTPDTAFGSTGRIAYRLKASSLLTTLGANYVLSPHQSLELFWQRAAVLPVMVATPPNRQSATSAAPTQSKYVDNLLGMSYLVQF